MCIILRGEGTIIAFSYQLGRQLLTNSKPSGKQLPAFLFFFLLNILKVLNSRLAKRPSFFTEFLKSFMWDWLPESDLQLVTVNLYLLHPTLLRIFLFHNWCKHWKVKIFRLNVKIIKLNFNFFACTRILVKFHTWIYTCTFILTALLVLMSMFDFKCSKTLSKFPLLAALKKAVLLSDCKKRKKNYF